MKTPLTEALHTEAQRQRSRFHVPSHAGVNVSDWLGASMASVFAMDFTELPSLDVLGQAQGVLRDSQAEVAQLFGAAQSFYLVNGASTGIMAALLACGLTVDSEVLVARNCHRSVLHGLVLTGATPHWLLPEQAPWGLWGALSPDLVARTLETHPNIQAVVMTHPTYEGIVSDVQALARVCKERGVLLIVDEAHGSLFPLMAELPVSAIEAGADVVIHSLHKSGGSLTQTALLHLPFDSGLSALSIQQSLNVLQTTSPSYVLLANLEATCAFLSSEKGHDAMVHLVDRLAHVRAWADQALCQIQMLSCSLSGKSLQLVYRHPCLSGEAFATALEESYGVAFESYNSQSVLLYGNLGLIQADFDRLTHALQSLDALEDSSLDALDPGNGQLTLPHSAMTPRNAFFAPGVMLPKEKSKGRIAKQLVASCPPGIPVLIPGEVVGECHLPYLPDRIEVVA